MSGSKIPTVAALILGLLASWAGTALAASASDLPTIAFVHVNVVPLDRNGVLQDQTVIVEGGKIKAVGSKTPVPDGATVIDGKGSAYLSPGLADMHTHSETRADLSVYLANGVTTVLNMGDASSNFVDRIKSAANRGDIPAPHVYTAFRVDGAARYGGFVVTTPDEARWTVRLAKANGHEFIKVYNDLSIECFDALIEEAKIQGLPIVGHGIERVGLRRQLAAGQLMVAHSEEFFYTVFDTGNFEDANRAPDDAQIPGVVDLVKRSHAFVTADLATYAAIAHQWGKPAVVDEFLRASDAKYLSPQDRISWKLYDYVSRKGSLDDRLSFLGRFIKAMSDAGVPLIAGTDAPGVPGMLPGFSLHDDLDLLVKAGLSRYEVIAAASRIPGEMILRAFPNAVPFGTVTAGSRADLILSDSNPLNGLDTLRKPLGVMAGGKWYSREDLQKLLDTLAKRYTDAGYSN